MIRASGFLSATDAVAALEFALILPVLLGFAFGGYSTAEYIQISRKVALGARTAADIASKYTTISSTTATTILNAPRLVLAPFPTEKLSVRLSEISTDATGLFATVTWSKALNTTPLVTSAPYVLSAEMRRPSTSYILSEVGYAYTPRVNFGVAGPFSTSSSLFIAPRSGAPIADSET